MDIIVTTPKSESENAAREADMCIHDKGGYYVRTFNQKPDIQVGDKIYYIEDGYIRGYAIACSLSGDNTSTFRCTCTKRNYIGYQVAMDAKSWKWIRPIKHRGFQGYRYAKLESVEVIGGWLDKKPEV